MTPEQKKTESLPDKANDMNEVPIGGLPAHSQSDVSSLIEPYRGELRLHCYRLLGSLQDAEDAVQETMLRAWRRFATFKGQASLRTWLYTIATNACLDALKKRSPRTLPIAASPASDPQKPLAPKGAEGLWLEPFPDSWLASACSEAENPEARYSRQESISLAFLTALQLLPPRQRAILLLSDVLDWRASEIAHLLEISVGAVNSALYRARVTLEKNYHTDEQKKTQPAHVDTATNTLLARYVHAWETDDVDGLVALLKEDATLSMPPIPSWYIGREAIRTILLKRFSIQNGWQLYPTRANTQPAFVLYVADESQRIYRAFGVQVLTIDGSQLSRQIASVTIFHTPLFVTAFGFPHHLSR